MLYVSKRRRAARCRTDGQSETAEVLATRSWRLQMIRPRPREGRSCSLVHFFCLPASCECMWELACPCMHRCVYGALAVQWPCNAYAYALQATEYMQSLQSWPMQCHPHSWPLDPYETAPLGSIFLCERRAVWPVIFFCLTV